MEEEEKNEAKHNYQNHHPSYDVQPSPTFPNRHRPPPAAAADLRFHPSSSVKGLRFGLQMIVRSFTARRSSALELVRLLGLPSSSSSSFPSTSSYLPTNFTILAHRAWNTLTLGLGTKNSKVVAFVFESPAMRGHVDRLWPAVVPLGDVNRTMIRALPRCEMARFKFRKGALTFYVYAVRRVGALGFARVDELRALLAAVAALKEFLDHTAMLAMPHQRTIAFPGDVTAGRSVVE